MTSETDKIEPVGELHSALSAWLAKARPRLAVAINVQRSTPDVIEFGFDLANPVLMGSITNAGDLVVSAEWQDECWDFLLAEEARPHQMAMGFVCTLCKQEGTHRVFPSREAVWHDHLFGPLEDFINTKLANAEAVALYRIGGGDSTWAKLISAGEQAEDPAFLVPLK